ncbi:MAG: hypothetical protein A3J55_03620 [Candidatus Ryanbacteria bacterium RIFCSPHIGHO2_02_FULL_45_17b]|uniref:Uncharacterized protein n=1 Tax=Candidatus Ryanbacteria bacterium RIFCSPHIGHO2_01_FULL_45_22 TaxID=1802114 RepID=A0A1G2G241_9BACT|nr:MAG: hypothetical protein A2719_04815 [Candidatus Ryanbacteria bacterium RIFCSPHIGHO2_01_FULL_45_22]OGZ47545.1 MAG: hypothetical protein A3J55_03620 [Candidatus Ryanbacteria bacterium RIFCSPHIGHO2_02_FULL_45_17b]
MLQVVLLFIGIVGLFKRKIKISSKREISGIPVILLSCFYLLMAGISLLFSFDLVMVGIIGFVTLLVVIFAKGQPVTSA